MVPTVVDLATFLGGSPTAGSRQTIEIGFQVFSQDGGDEFGAVRGFDAQGLIVYIENAGDFHVPLAAIRAVHSQKVILDCARLSRSLRRAIERAHDGERPGL
jgi:hypothetical protein